MRIKGKDIVVTGGTGIIGEAVVRRLVEGGATVSTLSRRGARNAIEGVEARQGDVTDPRTLDFKDADIVVHGAAFVGFGLTPEKDALMMHTNVEGTHNVLDSAARDGVKKVLHISSVAAIGRTGAERHGEDWVWKRPQVFHSMYERSKYEAHKVALQHEDVDVAAIMPSIVLGVHDSSSGLILKRHFEGHFPASVRHPGKLAWVHARDVAEGAILALEKGGGAYVLSETEMTLPELWRRIEDITGLKPPRPELPFWLMQGGAALSGAMSRLVGKRSKINMDFVRAMKEGSAFDNTRARTELGWEPDMDRHIAEDWQAFRASRNA